MIYQAPSLNDYNFAITTGIHSGEYFPLESGQFVSGNYLMAEVTTAYRNVWVKISITPSGNKNPLPIELISNRDDLNISEDGVYKCPYSGYVIVTGKSRYANKKTRAIYEICTLPSTQILNLGFIEDDSYNPLIAEMQKSFTGYVGNGSWPSGDESRKNLLSERDNINHIYTYSDDFWLNDFDFTGCSTYNDDYGNEKAGILISPIHVIFTEHFQMGVGTKLWFAAKDGTVYSRTLVAKQRVNDTDLMIGVLDSELPSDIKFYKVLPSYFDYIPRFLTDVFIVFPNKSREVTLRVIDAIDGTENLSAFSYKKPPEPYDGLWQETGVGDSSNGVFLDLNGELILIGIIYSYITSNNIANKVDEINQIMSDLGGGYQLTIVNKDDYN